MSENLRIWAALLFISILISQIYGTEEGEMMKSLTSSFRKFSESNESDAHSTAKTNINKSDFRAISSQSELGISGSSSSKMNKGIQVKEGMIPVLEDLTHLSCAKCALRHGNSKVSYCGILFARECLSKISMKHQEDSLPELEAKSQLTSIFLQLPLSIKNYFSSILPIRSLLTFFSSEKAIYKVLTVLLVLHVFTKSDLIAGFIVFYSAWHVLSSNPRALNHNKLNIYGSSEGMNSLQVSSMMFFILFVGKIAIKNDVISTFLILFFTLWYLCWLEN